LNSTKPTAQLARLRSFFLDLVHAPRFVWCVLGLGFVLRLTWVLIWSNPQPHGDWEWLNLQAKRLAEGLGYVEQTGQPTAFWPIGYPLTLSLIYRAFGPVELAGKIANVFFSMGILIATYALGRRLFSEATARIGLVLLAVSPNQIAFNSLLGTEPLFTLLFGASLVVVFTPAPRPASALLLGALLGLACNVKPVTLGLFPLLFLCLWAVGRDWKQAATRTVIAGLMALAVLAPWLIRNRIAFGKWVVTNEAGLVLLVGNNPEATGQYARTRIIAEIYPKLQQGGQEEIYWNAEAKRLALQFIRENPGRFLQLGVKKLYHMYKHDVDGIWMTLREVTPEVPNWIWKTLTRTGHLYYAALMLCVLGYLGGSILHRQFVSVPNVCLLFVFYLSFVCFVFHGLPRYHYPLMPIFCLYAANFLAARLEGKASSLP
jgi:4-amino-4-deoxy-L-arabinose transferase-like glycosyltransferase